MNNRQEQIEQAKRLIATGISEDLVAVLHQQFPELKESEDERIRKELWEYFHDMQLRSDCDFSPSLTIDDILAYLERQKEPKKTQSVPDVKMYKKGYNEGYQFGYGIGYSVAQKEQKPVEWSEEDKGILLECILTLQNSSHWLLADKLSSLRPQPHWKPSEEQMDALKLIVSNKKHYAPVLHEIALDTLYNDLKKLIWKSYW